MATSFFLSSFRNLLHHFMPFRRVISGSISSEYRKLSFALFHNEHLQRGNSYRKNYFIILSIYNITLVRFHKNTRLSYVKLLIFFLTSLFDQINLNREGMWFLGSSKWTFDLSAAVMWKTLTSFSRFGCLYNFLLSVYVNVRSSARRSYRHLWGPILHLVAMRIPCRPTQWCTLLFWYSFVYVRA